MLRDKGPAKALKRKERSSMVIDFQSRVLRRDYEEIKRVDGNVILEPRDPNSGMTYFSDRRLGCDGQLTIQAAIEAPRRSHRVVS